MKDQRVFKLEHACVPQSQNGGGSEGLGDRGHPRGGQLVGLTPRFEVSVSCACEPDDFPVIYDRRGQPGVSYIAKVFVYDLIESRCEFRGDFVHSIWGLFDDDYVDYTC